MDGVVTYAAINNLTNSKRKILDLSKLKMRRACSDQVANFRPASIRPPATKKQVDFSVEKKIQTNSKPAAFSSLRIMRKWKAETVVTFSIGTGKIVAPSFAARKKKENPIGQNVAQFFKKSKKTFAFNPIFAKRVFSSFLILAIVSVAFFQNLHDAHGATYTWQQLKWSGGQTNNTDVHPGKVGGWDEYSSKDPFVKTTNAGNDVELNWTAGSSVQTSDTGAQDTPNGGGFNAGQHIQTKGRSAGSSARVDLGYGGIAAISAGVGHVLLISDNHKIWAWGQNDSGQLGDGTQTARLTPVQIRNSTDSDYLSNIEAVAAGDNHSLGLDADGTVWAWGDGGLGQLGNGANSSSLFPVKVKNFNGTGTLSDVIAISAGNGYSIALKKDGTVWAWGSNDKGQLGNAANVNTNLPVQVSNLAQVSMITSGINSKTTMAVTSDGNVWAWGDGGLGQLGNGALLDSNIPLQVSGVSNVISINGGKNRSVVLKSDKTVWSWGSNVSGELGDGTNNSSDVPVQVLNLTDVNYIGGGSDHSLAIRANGTVWAWGNNSKSQLGDGTVSNKSTPVPVEAFGSGNSVMVSGGEGFSVALKLDGTVWTWGWNFNGKLGVNDVVNRSTPVQVWGSAQGIISGFSDISSGYAHNLGLKSDGTVWAWGSNGFGQLGDGTNINRLTPIEVVGLTDVIAIAAGYNHSLALKSDGTVWSWGWNSYGQLGDGTQTSQSLPVQVKASSTPGDYLQNISAISLGDTHSLALRSDGTVWAWGGNGKGQIGIGGIGFFQPYPQQVKDKTGGSFLTNVSSISGGGYYSLASLYDGTAWSWGSNDQGQLGDYSKIDKSLPVQVVDPSLAGITNVAKISAGYAHSFALLNDGSLLAWGWNDYGQLGTGNSNSATIALPVTGAGASNVNMVKAGNNHSIILKNDGTVWTWGWNAYGQLGNGNTVDSITPVQVGGSVGSSSISMISCGYAHSVALMSDASSVWVWGGNGNGQLGQNNNKTRVSPVQVWGTASGTINAGHTFYFSSGTFNSAIIDSGSIKTFTTLNYSIVTPANTSATVDIKAGNTPTVDGNWISLTNVSNGGDISALGQQRYYQYSVNMATTNSNTTPSFDDITLNYNYFPSPGHLVSSAYDTSDASNILSKVSWSRSLATGTNVQFQVRTAPDQAGNPGTWTGWVGPDGTSNTYFSDNTGGQAMPSLVSDVSGDQWIQYQALLISDGINSPILSDVTLQYVVNAPPEVQNVVASQGSDGLVTVNYDVRDPDSSVPQNVTPGKVIIGLQYCTANCAASGSEVWANAATVNGDVGANISVEDVNWKSYQLTWNAKSDYPQAFNGSNFKVRVKANDSEGANNLGYGKSSNFVFDTKNPVNVNFFIDHTANKVHLTSPIDDSSYQMIVSNFGDFHDATYQAFQSVYDYSALTNDPATVHLRIKDAKGNYADAVETTPFSLSDVVFYDISNSTTGEYRELISWRAPVLGEMGSGGFAKYNIWRSIDGSSYSLVNSITDKNVNYYLDSGLSNAATYSYKITLEDADGNISAFSAIVNDMPNGEGGANVTPAVISNVDVPIPSINSSSATITWDTDAQASSTVGFSTTPGDFSSEVGNATLVTSGHSVTLTGLAQNQTYYFRVKSIGVNNGVSVDDNFDVSGNHNGFSFTTTTADIVPPVISAIASLPTTTSTLITWSTNEAATSFVEYSVSQGFSVGSSYGSYDLTLSHSITLPSLLSPNTTYYYKLHSKDGSGNEAISDEQTFQTSSLGDITAPVISAVSVFSKTHNTATIDWITDETATSYVEYGTTTSYGKTFGNSTLVSGPPFNHSVALPQDLVPQTTYHYRVHSADASNNEAVSIDYSFTTNVDPQDVTAPTLVSGPIVTAFSATSATITWVTDEDSTSFIDYSPTLGNFQLEQGSLPLTQLHSVTLVNLIPDTAYYYQLKSADASGNIMTIDNGGDGFTFVTSSGQPPVLQGSPLATKNAYNAFTISWSTDINATSFVEFATESDFSNAEVFGKYDNVKNHSVSLQGLATQTTYYYRVRSTAQFEMVSGSYSFVTDPLPAAPIISAVSSDAVTYSTATVNWTTDVNADSYVEYGTTTSYGKTFGNSTLVKSHSINLPADLAPETTYHYRVHSTDVSGTKGTSSDYTFLTLTNPIPNMPQITNVTTTGVTYNTATVNWTTDINADSYVEYGTTTAYGKTFGDSTLGTAHSINLPGDLAPDTTYHYRVHSTDGSGNKGTSGDFNFKTDITPVPGVPQITAVTATGITYDNATINWTTDVAADSYVEYGTTTAYGKIFGNGELTTSHSVVLPADLAQSNQYYYRVHSTDGSGNKGVSAGYTFTTSAGPDLIRPLISNLTTSNIIDNGVTISWNTSENTDSIIYIGETAQYSKIFGSASDATSSHSVDVTGLASATTYFYQVVSKDTSGNVTYGSMNSFTTDSLAGAPVISNIQAVVASDAGVPATYNQVTITWDTDVVGDSKVAFSKDNSLDSSIYHPADLIGAGHSLIISDLALYTTYNYKVSTKGANGITTVSNEKTFKTAKDPKYLHDPLKTIDNVVTTPDSGSASVTFNTDQLAKCVIEYRLDGQTYPGGLTSESDFNQNHRMQILSLISTTKYFFQINCQDNIASTPVTSSEYSFTTIQSGGGGGSGGTDKTLPVISGVSAGKATGENVIITWKTDKKTSSYVRYGTKSTFGFMVGNDLVNIDQTKYDTAHTVTVSSLAPATKYYYSVVSIDAAGNIAESSSATFTTATQSTLSSISIISKVLGEAAVTWSTTQNMTSLVEYGLTDTYGSKSESNSQTKAHEVNLTKLTIGQMYHFRVRSTDSAGNVFVSGDYAFQPKSPPVISNVAVSDVTESGATVTFATNVPSDAVAAYVAVGDPNNSGSQGQTNLVIAHSILLKNLTPGTEYTLKVQAKDESGNASELVGPNFTIGKDTTPPVIDQIHTDSALTQNDKVQSIISWTTSENATTSIVYREGKNGEDREINIGDAYIKNHLAVMTVFKPGAVYFFKVKSVDEAGNEGVSNDFALLTPKKKENIIQIIINNFQEIFHWANMQKGDMSKS